MTPGRLFAGIFLLLAVYSAIDPFNHSAISEFPDFVSHPIEMPPWSEVPAEKDDQNLLQRSEIKFLGQIQGPESLAFDPLGRGPYTGVADGRVLFWNGEKWTDFAYTSDNSFHCQLQELGFVRFSLNVSGFCNWFGRSCVCAQPSPSWNNITSFSLCTEKNRCSIKFNLIHSEVVPRHWMLKMFASVGSVNADTECEENHVSSRVSSSRDSMSRTKPFPDESSNQSDGADNFHVQLEELFDEIKLTIKMGRKRNARDLLQANFELVKEQIGGGAKGIEQAATLDIVALGHLLLGDLKIVGQILNTLQEIVDSLNDGTPILDTVLTHMGSMYSALGKYNKSTLVYQRGIRLLEKKYGKSSTFLVSPFLGMAKGLASVKSTKKAVEIYHRAIHILESSSGAESEDLIVPLFALGNLLVKEGNATDAETPFLRILSIYSKLYGENDGRVGMAMASIAHAKCASGKTEEAIDLYKSALQILKCGSHVTIDDGVVEKMKIDLAELLHVVGRGKEGRELLEECLLITEKSQGKEHPSSVPHLLNLATSYSQSKNYVEAERLLRTSLEIKRRNGNPEDPSITFPMLQLAVTLYQLKRDEEAEQLALDALHIRQKAFGNNSMPAGEAMDCLVCIQSRLGKAESELLEMLQRVLKIQEANFGVGSEKIMPTLKKIVFYLDKLGRKDEKLLMQRRLSALKNKFKQMVHY
ncbi:Protein STRICTOSIDINE SYNTHASE-LIKE 3 [Linum perenne]